MGCQSQLGIVGGILIAKVTCWKHVAATGLPILSRTARIRANGSVQYTRGPVARVLVSCMRHVALLLTLDTLAATSRDLASCSIT